MNKDCEINSLDVFLHLNRNNKTHTKKNTATQFKAN